MRPVNIIIEKEINGVNGLYFEAIEKPHIDSLTMLELPLIKDDLFACKSFSGENPSGVN